jgi:hypothetical protein
MCAAHIWPNHTAGVGLDLFNLRAKDLNNPRNFLRLHREIEIAFDHRQLTIYQEGEELCMFVLDPSIMHDRLEGTPYTFGDCHRRPLSFHNQQRPYYRVLACHVSACFRHAEHQGWIEAPQMSAGHVWATEMARHSLSEQASANLVAWMQAHESPAPSSPSSSATASASSSAAATAAPTRRRARRRKQRSSAGAPSAGAGVSFGRK